MAQASADTSRWTRPAWWGAKPHIVFTIVVFIFLASLDNAAIGVLPPLYAEIADDLSTQETTLGVAGALSVLIAAVAAALWGYWGDRSSRKLLLLYGTVIWTIALFLTGMSGSIVWFVLFQAIAAIGFGCIASVGFSVLSDFVTARRRGFIMSLWGLSQGLGMGVGVFVGGQLGADEWRLPLFVVATAGLAFAALYLLTYEPKRGRVEPEVPQTEPVEPAAEPRIELSDVPRLATKPSNVWLILQGFAAQLGYGSLIWLPRLYAAKTEALGYSMQTATRVGGLFAILFQVGGVLSVLGGYVGDRWQQRDPRGRAMLSAIGVLGAVPLFLTMFQLPMHGLDIPDQGSTGEVAGAVLWNLVTNGWVAAAFILALGAVALTSADSPNWFALLSEVNLPEHRGTAFGLANLSNGAGRALGIWLTPAAAVFFAARFDDPMNFALGLAVFQLFFLPAGYCYYRATKTTPKDIADARETVARRTATSE